MTSDVIDIHFRTPVAMGSVIGDRSFVIVYNIDPLVMFWSALVPLYKIPRMSHDNLLGPTPRYLVPWIAVRPHDHFGIMGTKDPRDLQRTYWSIGTDLGTTREASGTTVGPNYVTFCFQTYIQPLRRRVFSYQYQEQPISIFKSRGGSHSWVAWIMMFSCLNTRF